MTETPNTKEALLQTGLSEYAKWAKQTMGLPDKKASLMAPLALAYLGDAVYELMIRTTVVSKKDVSANRLNQLGVRFANAKTQAKFVDSFWDQLSEEEQTYIRKGKNAKVGSIPKSCTPHEYHLATGFECMCGYLFMDGQFHRLVELFSKVETLVEME